MPQIVFAAFLFPTDFTDNTDFRPDRSEVIVTQISQMTRIMGWAGLLLAPYEAVHNAAIIDAIPKGGFPSISQRLLIQVE